MYLRVMKEEPLAEKLVKEGESFMNKKKSLKVEIVRCCVLLGGFRG
jgi:hypothetical protein